MNFPFQYTCFWTPRLSESLFHSQKSFLFLSYRKIQWQKITETTQCSALCIKCQSRFFLKWHTRTLPGSASVHTHSSDIPLNVHTHTHANIHTHARAYKLTFNCSHTEEYSEQNIPFPCWIKLCHHSDASLRLHKQKSPFHSTYTWKEENGASFRAQKLKSHCHTSQLRFLGFKTV